MAFILFKYLFVAYAWSGLTFIFFVAIMTIKNQWMKLPLIVKVMLIPWGVIGLLLDVLLNLLFSWLLLLSMPREMLFTAHCDRLLNDTGIQGKLAREWCDILSFFDPGHCRKL